MANEPEIVHEDGELLVLNKPVGLAVHAARHNHPGADEPTLVDWLLIHAPQVKNIGDDPVLRPGIVHRLDRATSGIMVVAKTQAMFDYLKKLFQTRAIEKKYLAVVHGVPKEKHGVIAAPIGIRNGTLKRSTRSEKMAKPAVTEYRTIRTFDGDESGSAPRALLEVMPKTGRTHQIRVHLASIGHPIVGDRLYGRKNERAPRLMLHALSIEFTMPNGQRVRFEAEPPIGFEALIHS